MSSHDLVNAIIVGDAIEIENAFQSTISEKISARLDDYRQEVAQTMFKVQESSEELDEEQLDELSKTTLGSYVKKATGGLEGAARHAFDAGRHMAQGNDAESNKSFAKSRQRISGIKKAVDRLTK
jgi:ribosome-associated translation inhibitor RaiA